MLFNKVIIFMSIFSSLSFYSQDTTLKGFVKDSLQTL